LYAILVLAVVGGVWLPPRVAAQAVPPLGWVSGGVGVGTIGVAGHIAGSVDARHNVLTIRGATAAEIFGDDFWDVGFLYGRSLRRPSIYAALSAGVGIAGGTHASGFLGSNNTPKPQRFTVPLEAQVGWRPSAFLGLGVVLFASLNESGSFGGATLELQLGKLR
jgi:hypothetical protein